MTRLRARADGRGTAVAAGMAMLGALLLGSVAMPGTTSADGGLVRARSEADRLVVTLLTSPTPLRVGAADVSALVQDERGGALLDAEVVVRLEPLDGDGAPVAVPLTRAAATNKLLQAASLPLPAAGRFRLTAIARHGARRASASAEVEVAPPAPPLRSLAAPLALPPLAIALYAANQALRRRPRRASTPAGGTPR